MRAWEGQAFTFPVAENSPGISPYFPIVPNFVSPCGVAPDQWGDASVGGFYNVEVGEGVGIEAPVCRKPPILVRGCP